jgi:dephospho-CoA kinase
MDYVYDYVVNNSGDINNLDKEVERFAEYIHRRMNT